MCQLTECFDAVLNDGHLVSQSQCIDGSGRNARVCCDPSENNMSCIRFLESIVQSCVRERRVVGLGYAGVMRMEKGEDVFVGLYACGIGYAETARAVSPGEVQLEVG